MYSIENVKKWFESFTHGFDIENRFAENFRRKIKHSERVSLYCVDIAESLGWNEENDRWLAETAGLLHDVGRFEQLSKYKTFVDSRSIDHGDYGADFLKENFDWTGIAENDKNKILFAVRYHNKIEIRTTTTLSEYKLCALVRDADKIDDFGLIQEKIDNKTLYSMFPTPEEYAGRKLSEKELNGVSAILADEIRKTGRASWRNVCSFYDFRLVQLAWILDLNYLVSYETVKAAGYIDRIAQDLSGKGVDDLIEKIISK